LKIKPGNARAFCFYLSLGEDASLRDNSGLSSGLDTGLLNMLEFASFGEETGEAAFLAL